MSSPETTNPDAGSDCLGFATADRVAPSDPAKGRGKTTLPCDPVLQIERWPDRKRKVLSKVNGNTSTVLATFVSDEAAADFLSIINDRLIVAYQLGKQVGETRDLLPEVGELHV